MKSFIDGLKLASMFGLNPARLANGFAAAALEALLEPAFAPDGFVRAFIFKLASKDAAFDCCFDEPEEPVDPPVRLDRLFNRLLALKLIDQGTHVEGTIIINKNGKSHSI